VVDTPISKLSDAGALTGEEVAIISQLSTSIKITATTISALASDNSFNDSANGFVAAGFAVDDYVHVSGFTGSGANNIFSAKITALTAGKMTIGGTDGNVIVDDAAGESVTISKWVSRRKDVADFGGGGGSSSERTRSVPVVADFTLQNAGTASITNVTSGIKLSSPSAASNFRFVRHNAALPATPWTVIARIAPMQPRTDTTQFQCCLAVRNSNGRMLMMHDRGGKDTLVVDNWPNYTAPNAPSFQLGATRWFNMPWQRMTFDGTTFAFGCSPDGHDDTFYDFYTQTAATYLTAVGGSVAEVGWGNWVDSGAYTIAEVLESFEVF
jgi:hypothetical protein